MGKDKGFITIPTVKLGPEGTAKLGNAKTLSLAPHADNLLKNHTQGRTVIASVK